MEFVIDKDHGPAPRLSQPRIVGHFSMDGDREYQHDMSQLKYYRPLTDHRRVSFDLNRNYKSTIPKPDREERIDVLLHWILDNYANIKEQNVVGEKWLGAEIVCFRGLLTKIFITPYNREFGWIICASKFRGTIYLCAYDTEKKIQDELTQNDYRKKCSVWGYKFEQYLLADKPTAKPDPSAPLNISEEFCCMFRAMLGSNSLLYGAEIDGICSKEPITDTLVGKDIEFVELKTLNRSLLNKLGQSATKLRLLKWWCQSYLANVQKIVCGCRDQRGFITLLKEFRLSELTEISKYVWDDKICRSFSNDFLDYVKKTVTRDHDQYLYKFTLNPEGDRIHVAELSPECEYKFLQPWYVKAITEHNN